ncbi:KpsF/GutQ family sugar-phosphate isomerase [Candidatus Magnetominusculus xianensis]|nr:KpsF/GutQ family sugar-phosphate isomerase [Candidatus Magnetominusculus xianensis]MBF0404194.1 KpsF/GutQ family sugar-phosphate isomerase [Nitrospirota bacterium]
MLPEEAVATAIDVLQTEADSILALRPRIDKNFLDAVQIIYDSKGKTVVTGMGKSGLIGKKIAATLASTGTPAFFVHPAEAGHGDLGMITRDDVIIAISNSGETDEIIQLIPFFKRFGVSLISLVGNINSTLARAAMVVIDISVEKEACPLGIVPTSSTTAAAAMGDAIAVVLIKKRGFKQDDFACLHPDGSLGRRLLIRVKDVMVTGDALPFVRPDTKLMDAVIEISSKRLGLALVTGRDKRLLGIVTDGDLRRGLLAWGQQLYSKDAASIMTANPRTISEEELAAKALSIMEKHSITSLIVPEASNTGDTGDTVKGIIHIHDILKKGIV